MAEPRIQYAKASDGVSIAYWRTGDGGTPLVYMPNVIWSHAQIEWQFPEMREWYERLAQDRELIRFDTRGTGLSERAVGERSVEAFARDLAAVVERANLGKFDIFAAINAVPAAILYAVSHPQRVSHLVLWCYAPNRDVEGSRYGSLKALQETMHSDWETYTEMRANMQFGWGASELAHRYAAFLRECTTPDEATQAYRALEAFDISPLLPQVVTPALVLHRRQLYFWDVRIARSLATAIPDAHFALLDGVAAEPYAEETDAVLATIDGFLAADREAGPVEGAQSSGTAVILFLDIADSTALTSELGDTAYRERERGLDAKLRDAIRDNGGSPVEGKVLGDGVMAVFSSARQAIDAARRCRDLGDEADLPLHLGLHAGDVVREGNNVHGGAVQVASRVQSEARTGEILVSRTVRDLARTSAGVAFEDRGERELKGIAEPVRLYAVLRQAQDEGPSTGSG